MCARRSEWSPPTRGRGLKYTNGLTTNRPTNVAPYAGAWIEIIPAARAGGRAAVAPYAGAWIEMFCQVCKLVSAEASPPTRGRGLKSYMFHGVESEEEVAPYAGAWIEISAPPSASFPQATSPPTRGRGLKLTCSLASMMSRLVAPYAGAWIEITFLCTPCMLSLVAPYAGAWIEMRGVT